MGSHVEQSASGFSPRGLANTAWSLATVAWADAQLFTELARKAEQRMSSFTPQEIANTA